MADLLRAAGLDVVHVRDIGLHAAHDETVLAAARSDARVLVSADTDFGTLLARSNASGSSFVLMRRAAGRRADEQAQLILDNLDNLDNLDAARGDLERGAIVVLGERTVRIRRLPIGRD